MRISPRGTVTGAALLAGAVALSMSLTGCGSIGNLTSQLPGTPAPAVVAPVAAKPAVVPAVVPEPAPTSVLANATSMGGGVTTVPSLLNLSADNAVKALTDAHLTYHIDWRAKTTVDSRSVIAQSPKANQTVDVQTPVTLTIQTGRRPGTIDVHRKALDEYAAWQGIPDYDTWDQAERTDSGFNQSPPPKTPSMPEWFWREDVN